MYSNRSYIITAFLILSTCMSISLYLFMRGISRNFVSDIPNTEDIVRHRSYSSDPQLYAITATSTYTQKYSDTVLGGIVSHHLLANIDISKFFAEFTDQNVDKVIIVGPNHYYPSDPPFLSTSHGYITPFGDVEVDKKLIDTLVTSGLIELAPGKLEEEHSISSLVPYVSAYFPNAKIAPVIVSSRASNDDLEALSNGLIKNASENTVVIASVDFSHHLYSNASQIHDARAITSIQNFDYDSILNSEVDSPGSLFILLKYLESKGAKNITLEQQSSANIFKKHDSEDVTSYVFAHARVGNIQNSSGASILFFGDTMLGRGSAEKSDLFTNISGPEGNFLKGYDAVVINLEGSVERKNCALENDDLLISSSDLSILKENRITHVGIMNDNFHRCPLDTEVEMVFSKEKLTPISESGTTIRGTNIDVEILSFFASPVPENIALMAERVRLASLGGKTVVVNVRWGIEYDTEPSTHARRLAYALIDAGADAIIGHHPRVIQPIEVYKNGIIFYSLGNFISDQSDHQTKDGFAVGLFATSKYIRTTIFPLTQQGGAPTHFKQFNARTFCERIYNGDLSNRSVLHPCVITIQRQ